MEMHEDFHKDLRSLDAVFEFLDKFALRERLDSKAAYALTLAVEEFFTNIVKYSKAKAGMIGINAARTGETVTVKLEEETPIPFDVTLVEPLHVAVSPAARTPGGLGIHLARCMLDELRYDYEEGMSTITLIKQVREGNV
jgi:anti-sigma regulatory factor (Ser/Thr protein kinase)